MGLVNCKECGGKVSTEALSCPHCGKISKHNIPPTSADQIFKFITIVFIVVPCILVIAYYILFEL